MMRKIVIDGSNTCGFQRTGIIALDGYIETSRGKIGIPTIAIEEESSGIIGADEHAATYRLDRLGIPLVEIATTPDIKDGQHLLEVAEKIGMILRATGKVARGLGTIRQDVNVSIEGGARVEIKGVQDLKMLPLFAEIEAKRQAELLKIISERGKTKLSKEISDVTDIFANTNAKLIKAGIAAGNKVLALKLEHHAGLLGREIQPNKRYGTELSDYAKTAGVKGIIHSDEQMDKYNISDSEQQALRSALKMAAEDAFVLVVAEEKMARKALHKAAERAAMNHVPSETRRANPDGTTTFMRPVPGRARMYPETDIPLIQITDGLLKRISKGKGESLEDKKEKLLKLLNREMAEQMIKSRNLALFEKLVAKFKTVDPMLIANTFENTIVSLRREGIELPDADATLHELFEEYSKGKFVKAAIPDVLRLVAKGKTVSNAVKEGGLSRITGTELEKIAKENNFDMKKIMAQYRLRIEAEDIAKLRK
jgi:glutamyl-tRNA(Gln) amidotransferase subunit E